ncbi:HmuY family protein [Flavobacterium sp. FlaQc-52]|jgi:hypothetical protein|uniref:HmuY family protein n=1 Tax=Flavobacterium sp. FlaQc-52 TaxID=3374185 RepID=UPI00375727B0
MKTNFLKLSLLAVAIFMTSCSSDDDKKEDTTPPAVVTQKVSDIYAPQSGGMGQPTTGDFTKFSFSENKVVTSDKWDIAFRGTAIIVNGGTVISATAGEPNRTGSGAVSIVSGTFASVNAIPAAATFTQDATAASAFPTSGANAWYDYNGGNHLITAKAGKVFVVKTHDGKYAKFEILSYYKGAPVTPDPATATARYYTFNFAYQANSTTTF